ncbi:MAG: ATP-binding cassette domain-containing protein, partial [Gammaproteobacteria bacterium]|nr:ATP-binding cassette domain-containing protein [Gammaproteobacteria bacterium]
ELEEVSKGFDGTPLFSGLNLLAEVGERIAVIGPNGIGKTTLLRTLVHDMAPDTGHVKWSENANIGYYAQDHSGDFENDMSLFDWMSRFKQPGDDEQAVRGILGRMLFTQNDIDKSVTKISGGEQGRMIFGKLMMQHPNILVLDEPTNHLDMESIEALNLALENYAGTLIFVSHDREFVSSLATRIIELSATGINNYSGTYEEYLRDQADTPVK